MRKTILNLLELANLDSLALELKKGTWISNRNVDNTTGLKIPPANLMNHVAGTVCAHRFVWSGRLTVTRILDLAQIEGLKLQQVKSLLDFGCGCGRLTRYLLMLLGGGVVVGSDTDVACIRWCQRHLNLGRFVVNDASPHLVFGDNSFDMAVSYSVFTHVRLSDQLAWLRELGRVIRPGGILIFSTQGYDDIRGYNTTEDEIARFNRGEIVERHADLGYHGPSNYGIFHPRGTVEQLARDSTCFEHRRTLEALVTPPMSGAGHNLHLWRKL